MSTVQLEVQLNAAQRDIQDLKTELAALREVLDETFRSAGLMQDWCYAQAQRRAPAPAIAPPQVEPTPVVRPTYNASELRELTRAFFPDGPPSLDQIKMLIAE